MSAQPIQWRHDALASDLAHKLRHDGKAWTWENATIGAWSGPRPDVMAFPRYRYDLPQIHAYEIKVSRADLLSDLNSEKWRKYQEHCQSVTFAMPHGLAKKEDLPAECGVMFRTGRGWRTERRATNIGAACSIQAMAKLLTCHPSRERVDGVPEHLRSSLHYKASTAFLRECGEKYGQQLAKLVAQTADGKSAADLARQEAEQIRSRAEKDAADILAQAKEFLVAIGADPELDVWGARQAIREAQARLNADSRVQSVEDALKRALRALQSVDAQVAA